MAFEDMLRGLEEMLGRIESLSRNRPFTETLQALWNPGPRAEVFDQGNQVRVVVEAPGLDKEIRHRWSARVDDQTLLLRGVMNLEETVNSSADGRFYGERRTEQFTRAIPLPCRVERKPVAVRWHDGLLTLVFRKRQGKGEDDGWIELR